MKNILNILLLTIFSITQFFGFYSFGDYKDTVNQLLKSIESTNQNKDSYQKSVNYQSYIQKIDKLTNIDTRTKTLLKQYLQTKITETKKQNQNNGLGEISNINKEKVRQTRLDWHNTERKTLGATNYIYDTKLESSATSWAKHLAELNKAVHKRISTDGYYNYDSIKTWFDNQGIQFKTTKGTLFSESLGRGYYNCKTSDCTDTLIKKTKSSFDFFMSEKKANGPHYKGIVSKQFTKMGIGIATNSQGKYFVVVHYSVDLK